MDKTQVQKSSSTHTGKESTQDTRTRASKNISQEQQIPKTLPFQTTSVFNIPTPAHLIHLQRTLGNQAVGRILQAKLTISHPDDPYEREADQVADQVMRMPEPETPGDEETKIQTKPLAGQITPLVHRMPENMVDEGDETIQTKAQPGHSTQALRVPSISFGSATGSIQKLCAECAEEEPQDQGKPEMAQRKQARYQLHDDNDEEEQRVQPKGARTPTPHVTPTVAANIHALNHGGSPLPKVTRAFFEPRFGVDLSQVRVHTGSQAAETAKSINARAFTVGNNIAFGGGQYAPESNDGRRLLAHELTHTIQQGGSLGAQGSPVTATGAAPKDFGEKIGSDRSNPTFFQAHDLPRQSAAIVQRSGGDEIRVEFVVDRLQRAIKNDSKTTGDVHSRFVTIDVDKAAAALEGLTLAQAKAVETVWKQRDGRSLRELIAVVASRSGNQTYLTTDQRRRLLGLLSGTVYEPTGPAADPWDPDAERRAVEQRNLLVDVAHLHAALPDPKGREAVFDILGRRGGAPGSPRFTTLNSEYERQWNTGLYVDLTRYLRGTNLARAEALLEGRTDAATGLELEQLGDLRYVSTATAKERVYTEQIEARLELLRQESGGDLAKGRQVLDQAVSQGTRSVGKAIRYGSGEPTRRVLDALASGSDASVIAAKLARLESEKRIKGTDIERALIELRTKAIMADTLDLAMNPQPVPLTQAQRAKREQDAIAGAFKQLGEAWFGYTGRGFEMLVLFTGTEAERERNRELLRGMGAYITDANPFADPSTHRSPAYIELVLAVHSWDSARIKAVLSGRSKAQIDRLTKEFDANNKEPLWRWLHAMLSKTHRPTSSTPKLNKEEVEESIQFLEHGAVFAPRSGGDRFDNLVEESAWYWQRIEYLYNKTMDNLGLFAQLRDWRGNLEHELVSRAYTRAKQAHDAIAQLAKVRSMKSGGEIVDHVSNLKVSFNRLRYNVDVYSDATRAAFLSFVNLAVNLVSIGVSFTTGGVSTLLVRGIVGTVGTKLVLLQEEYSASEFVKDVEGQAGGALGGQVAVAMLHRGIAPISQAARASGLRINPGISGLATKGAEWAAEQVGSTAGTSVATGGGLRLPSLAELADAAALSLAHKGKATISRPKGGGARKIKGSDPNTASREKRRTDASPAEKKSGQVAEEHTKSKRKQAEMDELGTIDSTTKRLPGEKVEALPELGKTVEARVTKEGYCKICSSPCQRELDMAREILEKVEHQYLGHAKNLFTRVQLLDDAIQSSIRSGTLDAEYDSRYSGAVQKISKEVYEAHRRFVGREEGIRVAAAEEIEGFSGQREGVMDDPRWYQYGARQERALEGTAYHDRIQARVVESLPHDSAFTENTIQVYLQRQGVDPSVIPKKSTGIDLYIFDNIRNVMTPVDIINVAGGKKHVDKLHKDVEKLRDALEKVGIHLTEPIEIEYVGRTFDEAANSIAIELRAFARAPAAVGRRPW